MASFLLPMLEIDPEKRATAHQMLHHPWLRRSAPMTWHPRSLTPRDFSINTKRSFSSDLDSNEHDSWIEENDLESKCPRYYSQLNHKRQKMPDE